MGDQDKAEHTPDENLVVDVKQRMVDLLDALVTGGDTASSDFEALLARAGDLWKRKQRMEGTKGETRDLIGEVIFSRLRRSFGQFHKSEDAANVIRAAEWVMGMLYSGSVLTDLACAFDHKMLDAQRQQDFSFAGQTTFISLQEVLQLLSGGGYSGMLAIEKADNRLDLFIKDGMVVMFDPHHLVRRALPGPDSSHYREIPADMIAQAEELKKATGLPLLVGLNRLGYLRDEELPDILQNFGLEVFYEFLVDTEGCTFFYRKLDRMPEFVDDHSDPMHVTPMLLEGSKRMDEWKVLMDVFPNPDAAVEPMPDMFARIDGMNLGVLEIKLLAAVNRGASPRQLSSSIGLPLFEVYQHLVRYARDGIIVPVGGEKSLADITFTLEETMEKAFEALDANDDDLSTAKALEDALGDPFGGDGSGVSGGSGGSGGSGVGESFLDILAAKDPSNQR
jgi:Domain of unknown function (DUF4388)